MIITLDIKTQIQTVDHFTVVRACWVIRTRWRVIQKFVWEFKVN